MVDGQLLPAGYIVHQVIENKHGESGPAVGVVLGLPWHPLDFVKEARKFDHPCAAPAVDDDTLAAIFEVLTKGTEQIKKTRNDKLNFWKRRKKTFRETEERLKKSMHPNVRHHLRDKDLLFLGG